MVLILIGILILVIIGCAAYLFFQKNNVSADIDAAKNDSLSVSDSIKGEEFLASMEEYEYYKNITFPVSEYDAIPLNYKRAIVKLLKDNGQYKAGNDGYGFTRIKDRAKKVFAFGNFTDRPDANKDNRELAFILEKKDFSSTALYIISSDGGLLFTKEFPDSELPIINSFKKGAKIYMEEPTLVPSPSDGLILKFPETKYVVIYDKKLTNFTSYYQYTEDDIRTISRENGDDATEAVADTIAADQQTIYFY